MRKITVYKTNRRFSYFQIGMGSLLLIAGLLVVIRSWTQAGEFDWLGFLFLIQGITFLILGYANIKSKKYFIEWDEDEMKYFLPESTEVEHFKISDITSIKISLFEVSMEVGGSIKNLSLGSLQFEDIKSVKQKFEDIEYVLQEKEAVN